MLLYLTILCFLCSAFSQKCNFDDGNFCNWIQSEQDDGNWSLYLSQVYPDTGPPTGHTSSVENSYILLNPNNFKNEKNDVIPNKTVILVSSNFTTSGNNCFRFFYYMYGQHVNSLSVGVAQSTGLGILNLTTRQDKITVRGDKGKEWFCGRFSFDTSSSFRIYIEAKTGETFKSVIALDDLEFLPPEQCDKAVPCDPTQTVPVTTETVTSVGNTTMEGVIDEADVVPSRSSKITTTSKPDEDNNNLLLYSIVIPASLLLIVSIIAIICYLKRPKDDLEFQNHPDIALRENPKYIRTEGIYNEIQQDQIYNTIYHDEMLENQTYLEPVTQNDGHRSSENFETIENDNDYTRLGNGRHSSNHSEFSHDNRKSMRPELPPRPCGTATSMDNYPTQRNTDRSFNGINLQSGFDSPEKMEYR